MKSRYILLSHSINKNVPLYGGAGRIKIFQNKNITKDDSCNTFELSFSNHTGTHIDCPYHFDNNGKKICDYKISDFIFLKPVLIDIHKKKNEPISIDDINILKQKINNKDIILIRTGFETFRNKKIYIFNNPFILPEVFEFLKEKFKSVKAVGIDTISISNIQNREIGRNAHKSALKTKQEILLIEDMKLSPLKKSCNLNEILIAPIFIEGVDSSPATVLAKIS
ncbi:MAG TPA: cyclase family protein [bacterium]|nr:cyclase family protein [bacterium]